jgi:hypothetical protein
VPAVLPLRHFHASNFSTQGMVFSDRPHGANEEPLMNRCSILVCICPILFAIAPRSGAEEESVGRYADTIAEDQPVAWWRFGKDPKAGEQGLFSGEFVGKVSVDQPGPRGALFPAFEAGNTALRFNGDGGRLVVKDVAIGEARPLQFRNGDALTLEAWVNVTKLGNGQQIYIVGKGRTRNNGYAAENQNYGLRLAGSGGQAVISFLFRDADNRPGEAKDFHRWNSQTGFGVNSGWHHVAVTYQFGDSGSLRGYIDGKPVGGAWQDYGGATNEPPVVDDDELWIGSSMGGNPSSSFQGGIDEVAVYRRILPAERIAAHCRIVQPPSYKTPDKLLVDNQVLVEIIHGFADSYTWNFPVPEPFERYTQAEWALVELPQLYNAHGVRTDRSNPLMVRLTGKFTFPAGEHRLLLRSRSAARVFLDGKLLVENKHPTRGGDGHGPLYEVVSHVSPHIRPLQPGDYEKEVKVAGTGKPQVLSVDVYAGGKKRRTELGEMCLALGDAEGHFQVLTFGKAITLTDAGWEDWSDARRAELAAVNQQRRAAASQEYAAYWDRRHQAAREMVSRREPMVLPEVPPALPVQNEIDRFIGAKLAAAKVAPLPLTDDYSFLRRVSLDVIGTIPTPEIVARFLGFPPETRRTQIIDWLLEQPGWADNWVGYWQDVLAENPNVVNPTLNNTGPFRYWLHESFSDNKPFDRFATELALMEGSSHFGGPAGFGMATQNDSPMAAKAYVLGRAFLALEMKCARCHDAPYHDFAQRDLFSLAAMLKRAPESVPKTSTVPGGGAASAIITVTLKPGEAVAPAWPFADLLPVKSPAELLEKKDDSREQFAALVTSPENPRFGRVLVNRLWKRYLGYGLVEPVDDWETADPSHPELLEFLERDFIRANYDVKHVARLILNSHAYQRQPDAAAIDDRQRAALFAGPSPRRMSAEQIVDSLFSSAGKSFRTEELNIDVDGLRSYESSLGFGFPERAWEFTSMSNERDRPSLALPASQTILNLLETFGWRSTRPDPISVRPQDTTVLQPAILSNGVAAKRISQLSDDSRFTRFALEDVSLDDFIRKVYQAVLTRPPSQEELRLMTELLTDGYQTRRKLDQPAVSLRRPRATGVCWTNHLQPEASSIKIAFAAEVEKGDPPTLRLEADWRERAEDFVWTLVNSPEFLFIP